MHLAKADSFKAATPLILALIEQGWKETRANNDGSSRDYFFVQDGIELALWVWPHSGSGLCKRVPVKTEEYTTYKLVCDDENKEVPHVG